MMLKVRIDHWSGIGIYLVAITGISFLGTKLSSVVAQKTIILAMPYLDSGPAKLSLMEKRRIDAARAAQPLPEGARTRITALQVPSVAANILAARLDLAEKAEIDPGSPIHVASAGDRSLGPASPLSNLARVYSYEMTTVGADRPKLRTVRSNSRYDDPSAADVFNRSFGVLSVAAN